MMLCITRWTFINISMSCKALWVFLSLLFYSSAPAETVLEDLHLDFMERTGEEIKRINSVTGPTSDFSKPEQFETNSAGAATVRAQMDREAFSQPSKNVSFEDELDFLVGNGLFRKVWVSSPASTLASDGLGPLFNARSCQRCHIKDGRGHVPKSGEDNAISMILKVSLPGEVDERNNRIPGFIPTLPEPNYGQQMQDFSLPGIQAEHRLSITYEDEEVVLSDGEIAYLRHPTYNSENLGYGPLHLKAMFSPRVAQQMIGLGLLEAIPASDIIANSDPLDNNGDGISGRPNIVWSKEFDQPMLGRFGHKASVPTIKEQTAQAFAMDIGISSALFPSPWGDCTENQPACRKTMHGDGDERVFEIDEVGMDLVTFYSRNLGVPARRNVDDPTVLKGKRIFYQTGCNQCHTPKFVTHRLNNQDEQSFQLIWPYTDLLLHDMGEGLADNRPEVTASGREWRTPPLWGIGLTELVSGHTQFLHDGRARNLLEAILWHGGEAEQQREMIISMPKFDRDALLKFLESL